MSPHELPLPLPHPAAAGSMPMPRLTPSRATPAAVQAVLEALPQADPEPRDPRRCRLRAMIAQMLAQPSAGIRLKAATKICGADWCDAQRLQLLRALKRLPEARCVGLPAVQVLLAGSRWSAPGQMLGWALQAEADGQLPVWAAHGILPRLEGCDNSQRVVAQLQAVPACEMPRFWQRVEALCRGSRGAVAVPMDVAVDAVARLSAAQVSGALQAVAAAHRPDLAPLALGLGLRPPVIASLVAALRDLANGAEDPVAVRALAVAAQREPQALSQRVRVAQALRFDTGAELAAGLVAVCGVNADSLREFGREVGARRLGAIASGPRRVRAAQDLAAAQRSVWPKVCAAGAAALRWLRGERTVTI